jgi:hypothetical protein
MARRWKQGPGEKRSRKGEGMADLGALSSPEMNSMTQMCPDICRHLLSHLGHC